MGVDHRPNTPPFRTGDEDVADPKGATLHQDGGHRTPALFHLGFDDDAFGWSVGVGLEVEKLSLQKDHFFKLIEIGFFRRRDLDRQDIATHFLNHHFMLQQLVADAVGVGFGFVDFVDGDDDRHLGGLGVVDGFYGLRHDAVVGGDAKDNDIGDRSAAGAHIGKGLVARCVDKGDFGPRRHSDLVGADVLGNAAGFVGRYVGIAEGVQQRRLAVVHMAHHRNNRRPGNQSRILVLFALEAEFHIGFGDAFQLVAEFGDQQFRRVGIDGLVDGRHHVHFHQRLDDIGGPFGHAVG